MHNARPISSWSLTSAGEIKAIQRRAEEMRVQYLKGLVRRLFTGSAGRANEGQLSEQAA